MGLQGQRFLKACRGAGLAQVPLALTAGLGDQHTPSCLTGLSSHHPAVKGTAEEQWVLWELALWAAHQPAQDLVAPSSRQSPAPVAPHLSLGGPGPHPHSALGLAVPLALSPGA